MLGQRIKWASKQLLLLLEHLALLSSHDLNFMLMGKQVKVVTCNIAEAPELPAQLPPAAPPGRRSKKGKKRVSQQQPDENLYVNVVPLPSAADVLEKVRGHMWVQYPFA